ncbi:MAG: hypothetical protein AAB865_02295 [Patescibacteria group bacterium]
MSKVKLVVTVPETHADALREAIGKTELDKVGNYGFCSFSTKGIGRFKPLEGAKPAVGKVGELEEVVEERIEISCAQESVKEIVAAIKAVHPYEEPVIDIYHLESI